MKPTFDLSLVTKLPEHRLCVYLINHSPVYNPGDGRRQWEGTTIGGDEELGLVSAIGMYGPNLADIPLTHRAHQFMADLDGCKLAHLAQLTIDPIYSIVQSSKSNFHAYGPAMTWEQMNEIWASWVTLDLIDERWVSAQQSRGHATLRVSNNVKPFAPRYVGTMKELQRIPKRILEAM